MNQEEIKEKVAEYLHNSVCGAEYPLNMASKAQQMSCRIKSGEIFDNFIQPLIDKAREEGRREILDWGNEVCNGHGDYRYSLHRRQCYNCWQSKLQEWFPVTSNENK